MKYRQIKIDSLIKKITRKDDLFKGNYTIDPYQNCEFGCIYCDSSFEKTIYIKSNAPEILDKELKNLTKGTIIVGSVHDAYQKIEEKYQLTRKILKIIKENGFPCHILTKSDLVLRDIDLIKSIDNSMITFSILSLKKDVSNFFEKNVITTFDRLKTMKKIANNNIKIGVAIIPILPYLVEDELDDIIYQAQKHYADYILSKNLELKGDQKKYFLDSLNNFDKELIPRYEKLFLDSYKPNNEYIDKINQKIKNLCRKYDIRNEI